MGGRTAEELGEALARLATALQSCYDEDLLALVLYGSAAAGTLSPARPMSTSWSCCDG